LLPEGFHGDLTARCRLRQTKFRHGEVTGIALQQLGLEVDLASGDVGKPGGNLTTGDIALVGGQRNRGQDGE